MLLRLPPVLSAVPFRPLLLVIVLELLVLSNSNPQIEKIGEMSTLKIVVGLEVEAVKCYFGEFGLGHHNKTSIPYRFETVKIFLDHFIGILLI